MPGGQRETIRHLPFGGPENPSSLFRFPFIAQNLLDEMARWEDEVQKVYTQAQQYQQAVKVRRGTPSHMIQGPHSK